MKSIETQKLGYVAYPVIIGEIQNLAESLIDLSDEDFSSKRESLLKTEGIAVNRFPIGGKPDLISIKIYNESNYVSLIETVRDLESYEFDVDKFWKEITTEFQNYIKENKHKLTLSSVIYSSDVSVNVGYIAKKENNDYESYFSDYAENKDNVPQTDKPDKPTGGLIFTFEFVDEITLLALHDYHWIFDKWDSASEEDKEKSLNNPINSKTHPGFYIHYPQISNLVKAGAHFISVKFEYFEPGMSMMSYHTSEDINAVYESRRIFNRVKSFFDSNAKTYNDDEEITDDIREKYVGVFKQFGKSLLFLTKHYKIDYEARSYAEMIFTC